ncbi:MAG: lysR-type regulatory protein [Pseudomonadota bacterium]|nr:LysR family transcriptional regulator [Betaproteobacteria bacterium]
MNLRDIDLNLLVIFNQLLIDRRVSTTADKLGLSQPAVSNALKRLRTLLKDELFVRTARGMEPTPYALHLIEPIGYALSTLQNALNQRDSFDPATSERTFTLGVTDIGEIYFMPTLMAMLSIEAPKIKISTLRHNTGHLSDDMAAGNVDIAIGLLPSLTTGFFQRRLFKQRYMCLFRQGHPKARNPISLAQYKSLPHVGVTSTNTGHSEVDEWLTRKGISRDIHLHVPHFVAVGHILQSSDLIATVPERFAQKCSGPFQLETSPLPFNLPEIAINLFWHAKYNREPANMWLRKRIIELFSQ